VSAPVLMCGNLNFEYRVKMFLKMKLGQKSVKKLAGF
jgi:hypothetical protein